MDLRKIWINRREIWEGFLNATFRSSKIERVAAERFNICRGCESYDIEGKQCEVPGTQPCCGECGCSLKLKLRSMQSECPLGKWDAHKK
jgi:hypothetical protein